ncbi:hypothetical protein IAF53_20280 [Acinetobacter baumannii]|nr:hypothetical protein [Acinetobacter baumannii]
MSQTTQTDIITLGDVATSAIVTPILAKPTIVAISSERFSIITAMTSPLRAPRER